MNAISGVEFVARSVVVKIQIRNPKNNTLTPEKKQHT
jgi:hypothetical protein